MTSKKTVADMTAPTSAAEADALLKTADVVVGMNDAAIKAPAVPTVNAPDINKLAGDIRQCGGVALKVVQGTEVLRMTNEGNPAINNGKNEVMTLSLDKSFFGANK